MDLTTKLINLLDQYINEYKKQKEKYYQKRSNQTLYQELLNILTNNDIEENKISIAILLNTIYGDNIYVDEFYRILLQSNKQELLQQFIFKINQEYINLKNSNKEFKNRIDRNFSMFESAKKVKICLKYHTPISGIRNDIYNIKRILNYYEVSGIITNKEELLLINEIELHNRKVESKKRNFRNETDYTETLYSEIPNILSIGFQEHDVIEVSKDKKKTLDKFVNEIINLLNHISLDEIQELLENYKKYNLENSEYNYIIVKCLDSLIEELITLYELLVDKDIYNRRTDRIDVIKKYYQTLEKYLIIREYYNQLNKYEEELIDITEEENIIKTENEKRIIYASSSENLTKAKIITDLSSISYEYYENIYELLTKFKEGTLGNKKIKPIHVGNKSQGHIELKNDNTRIVLRRVKEGIYCVLGVLIKKGNNDMYGYRNITNRMTPDISTEEKLNIQFEFSKMVELELEKLVNEKGRKNGR